MTLNEIVLSALTQLGRSADTANINECSVRFSTYANQAQHELADAMGFYRTDIVAAIDGTVKLSSLPRTCVKVIQVIQHGNSVRFKSGETSDLLLLPYIGSALITYRCYPKQFARSNDECELDESVHGLIVTYVVGRERLTGDVTTQKSGNIYLSMYENAKAKLRRLHGEPDNYQIINKY